VKTVVAEMMMECRECMVLKVKRMAREVMTGEVMTGEVMTGTHPAEVTAVPRLRGPERA
jgi:hypothetical protein